MEPGGYFEIHDGILPLESDDGTLPSEGALITWCKHMVEGTAQLGRPVDKVRDYVELMSEAGFTGVTQRVYKCPINHWPKDKHYKELGLFSLHALARPFR